MDNCGLRAVEQKTNRWPPEADLPAMSVVEAFFDTSVLLYLLTTGPGKAD